MSVEQRMAEAVAEATAACAQLAKDYADALLGAGQWETAALFAQLADALAPHLPKPVGDDALDGPLDLARAMAQAHRSIFPPGYGRD